MEFQDKIVLITGAGSGIGQTAAQLFAQEGATVVVSDVNEQGGAETVAQIEKDGGTAVFIRADVTQFEEVEDLVRETVAKYGRLDIAINNAGIGGIPARTVDQPLSQWESVMAVNATGVFYCMKVEIAQMLQQGGGIILNTSSIAGLRGLPNALPYTASKHAVVGMTKTAAMEYARHNIRVNAICPVFTISPMFQPEVMEQHSKGITKKLLANLPMKRFAQPDEMAKAMLYLCSEQASFVTGHAMPVDGGLTA